MSTSSHFIGVMSGSSLDGLDVVEVSFENQGSLIWDLKHEHTYELPESLISKLKNSASDDLKNYLNLETAYTDFAAICLIDFKNRYPSVAQYCGFHGHTVWHLPEKGYSLQMLNGGRLAVKTALNIVTDFRNQDIARNGVGTPLAVIADRDLFKGYDFYLNLGGIANMSMEIAGQWIAFDIAPFNQVHNYFASVEGKPFDFNGEIAAKGSVNKSLFDRLKSEDFIQKSYPKAIDNSWIKKVWMPYLLNSDLSPSDVLATQNELVISEIQKHLKSNNDSIFITGGGAKNKHFIQRLKTATQNQLNVVLPVEKIIDYKEAILMAYLTYLRVNKKVNTISNATGAKEDSISGALYLK